MAAVDVHDIQMPPVAALVTDCERDLAPVWRPGWRPVGHPTERVTREVPLGTVESNSTDLTATGAGEAADE